MLLTSNPEISNHTPHTGNPVQGATEREGSSTPSCPNHIGYLAPMEDKNTSTKKSANHASFSKALRRKTKSKPVMHQKTLTDRLTLARYNWLPPLLPCSHPSAETLRRLRRLRTEYGEFFSVIIRQRKWIRQGGKHFLWWKLEKSPPKSQ